MRLIDLTGQRFNRLLVLDQDGHRGERVVWRCRCDCGAESRVDGHQLRSGKTKSCGCWSRDRVKKALTQHGMTKTPLFSVWKGMLSRCRNKNGASFKNYGGRGIRVCDRWMEFANFNEDMGATYARGLTIDRIDNEGNYEPGNCRWIARSQQNRNRRPGDQWDFKDAPITTSTTGIRGVSPSRRAGGWLAKICINGVHTTLGRFKTKEEAAAAYREAREGRLSNARSPDRRSLRST